jgi:acyl-CoA thioester hydrolase
MTTPTDKKSERDEVRANYPHFLQVPTRWMDNDVYGHVNNVTYYSYFDTAVNEFLDIGVRVRRLGNSSVTYEIGIFKESADSPSATGHFVHVYVRPGQMQPISVPDRVRDGLQRLVVEG